MWQIRSLVWSSGRLEDASKCKARLTLSHVTLLVECVRGVKRGAIPDMIINMLFKCVEVESEATP